MAKCFRCGKSTALRGTVQLKDATICGKCAKDLGMDKTEILIATQYQYDDIKDGMDVYYKKQIIKRSMLEEIEQRKSQLVSNYGQVRDLNCTEEESRIYDLITTALSDAGLDTSCMELVRKSNDYVSACMRSSNEGYGLMDVARIKFSDRAKWIKTGLAFEKTPIGAPEDVLSMVDGLIENYRANERYL